MARTEQTTKVVSTRIPEGLLHLIDLYSKDQRSDRAHTMRQWLYRTAEEYAVDLVEQGRLSGTRAAELLDVSIWDIFDMAERRGIRLGATAEQAEVSLKVLEQLRAELVPGD